MSNTDTKGISFRWSTELVERLDQRCIKKDKSRNDYVREIVERNLGAKPGKYLTRGHAGRDKRSGKGGSE